MRNDLIMRIVMHLFIQHLFNDLFLLTESVKRATVDKMK